MPTAAAAMAAKAPLRKYLMKPSPPNLVRLPPEALPPLNQRIRERRWEQARLLVVTVVVAHPALRIGGIFVPALGHKVEPLVCGVEHVDSTCVRRVRVEDRAGLVPVED